MFEVDNTRYAVSLALQLSLLATDVLCNALTVSLFLSRVALLVVVIVQVLGILASLVVLFLQFFNTFAFKAGLLYILLRKFAGTLVITLVYLCFTMAFGVWNVAVRWDNEGGYGWSGALQAAFVLHKMAAVAHYYLYKRSALRLGDARYYVDSPWIWAQLNKR